MSTQPGNFEVATPNTETSPDIIEKIMALFDHESSQAFDPNSLEEYPHVLRPDVKIDKAKAIVTESYQKNIFIFKHSDGAITVTSIFHNSSTKQTHDQVTFMSHDGSVKDELSSLYCSNERNRDFIGKADVGNVKAAIDSAYQRHFG